MSNLSFKPFDQIDWFNFSGADGSPKIATVENVVMDGHTYFLSIIVDDAGLQFNFVREEENTMHVIDAEIEMEDDQERAIATAQLIDLNNMSKIGFETLGFDVEECEL